MTTPSQAYAAFRAVIENATITDGAQFGSGPVAMLWYGDPNQVIPDFPQPFAFTIFDAATRASVIEIGGGRGANRHRNPSIASVFVCTAKDSGQQRSTDIAEQIAALFRPYNANGIICESATVYPTVDGTALKPPGSNSDVGNYMVAACEVEFYFDLIG